MASRLQAMGSKRYENAFQPTLHYGLINLPLRWKKPRIVFVNSMSDLFQEDVPEDFIRAVFATMEACPSGSATSDRGSRGRQNIWMGVSGEDERVMHRITDLAAVPARVRFLSCEPLIGPRDNIPLADVHLGDRGGRIRSRCPPDAKRMGIFHTPAMRP
jgi:protein gp37